MAYFSNGTEGMRYEEEWCGRCVHAPDPDANPPKHCPVLMLHAWWNYDQNGTSEEATMKREILAMFIPETEINGVKYADRCSMFFEAPQADPSTQLNMFGG